MKILNTAKQFLDAALELKEEALEKLRRTPITIKTISGKELQVSRHYLPSWKPRKKSECTPKFNASVAKRRAKNKVAKQSRKVNR